jgi:hypothetical protein
MENIKISLIRTLLIHIKITEEFHQINHDHQADPRWDSLRFLIADFRDVISIDLPEEEVMLIQAMDKAAAQSNPYLRNNGWSWVVDQTV